MEYATIESRLATFEPPAKRSKLVWPHKTPTPEDLARAGFYYKPSKSSNDNTICYLCESQLGGWEADDDPLEEHLKHSPQCGWAIVRSAAQDAKHNPENVEDPTGQLLTDARRATFAIGWPHESKRAWKCKTEKMIEAGWHFAPVTDGEDYVSCAYCTLSLDGWEPKDDPFVEHHRRSPDCLFFQYAGSTAPAKRPKAKKGRASKTSRTSKASTRLSSLSHTQDMSMMSETPSVAAGGDIPDLEDSIDGSEMSSMSIMSTASTATTKAKRKGRPAKATKSKKAKTTRSTRTKKEEPEPEREPELEAEPVQEIAETSAMAEPESEPVFVQAEQMEVEEEQLQPLPGPTPTPPATVSYPSIPTQNTPPRISNTPRHMDAIVVQDNSPTPIKPRSARTSLGSVAKSTTKSKRTTPFKANTSAASAASASQAQKSEDSSHALSLGNSPSTSDIENAPPSQQKLAPTTSTTTIPIALPSTSSKPAFPTWTPSNLDLLLSQASPAKSQAETLLALTGSTLTQAEKNMTVAEWIDFIAQRAEEGLRSEGERVVGVFEREGQRAMGVLEGIICI